MALRALRTTRAGSVAYRRIVVPLGDEDESELGVVLAAELAPEAAAAITAVVVVEVPAELPLEAHMLDEEALARRALEKAEAIAASRGVRLRSRIVRARARGEAIVVRGRRRRGATSSSSGPPGTPARRSSAGRSTMSCDTRAAACL